MNDTEKERLKNNLNKLIPKRLFKEFLAESVGIEMMPINVATQLQLKLMAAGEPIIPCNTWHYIGFNATEKTIMVLPFSFIKGCFPDSRLDMLFPDGYVHDEVPFYPKMCIVSSVAANLQENEKSFFIGSNMWIYGNALIGSIGATHGFALHALTFPEVLEILGNCTFGDSYSNFVFYPPC